MAFYPLSLQLYGERPATISFHTNGYHCFRRRTYVSFEIDEMPDVDHVLYCGTLGTNGYNRDEPEVACANTLLLPASIGGTGWHNLLVAHADWDIRAHGGHLSDALSQTSD
jgi:hypothetical protein